MQAILCTILVSSSVTLDPGVLLLLLLLLLLLWDVCIQRSWVFHQGRDNDRRSCDLSQNLQNLSYLHVDPLSPIQHWSWSPYASSPCFFSDVSDSCRYNLQLTANRQGAFRAAVGFSDLLYAPCVVHRDPGGQSDKIFMLNPPAAPTSLELPQGAFFGH